MQFHLERKHILGALDLTVNRTFSKVVLSMVAGAFILGLVKYHADATKMVVFHFNMMVVTVVVMLPLYLLSRSRFIKQFSSNPEFSSPIDCEVVNDELVLRTIKSTTAIPRSWVVKIKSNRSVTLLYKSTLLCHIIPAEVISADEGIRRYIENKPAALP